MGEIYEFDNHNHNQIDPKLLLENEIKQQMDLLKYSIWYHGVITRNEAENRIFNNGEFLVRFSEDKTNKFVVSSKWNGKYIHIVILTDIDNKKNCLVYYINPKFKFPSVFQLISFHKENQFPLSDTSEAVLYRAVDPNHVKSNGFSSLTNQRESKFRKSTNMFRKQQPKPTTVIPRSGSETYLTNPQRFSDADFSHIKNKSLSNLNQSDFDAPHKPKKPSFKLLNSKHLLLKLRPSNIKIRNKKLYKETEDYSDYRQVKDSEGALKRERLRRGFSEENRSPSLFGLNVTSSVDLSGKKFSLDESMISKQLLANQMSDNQLLTNRKASQSEYIEFESKSNSVDLIVSRPIDNRFFPNSEERDSTATLTANTPNTSIGNKGFDIYGLDSIDDQFIATPAPPMTQPSTKSIGLVGFIKLLSLANHQMPNIGPIQSEFDKLAINRAAGFLLSSVNHNFVFCKHLLDELTRVFAIGSVAVPGWQIGYRSVFLVGSEAFQRDLSIRQTALTFFIMATIVSTPSTEKRINMIFFWIKCADYLLTHVQDMYHFRAVFSAIFSEQILNLKVWKLVYRQDPTLTYRMACMKEAVKNGCLLRTDIEKCVPDLVHLCNVYAGNEEDLTVFSNISISIAMWTDQAFNSSSTWLRKISKELDTTTVIPHIRELVQTETLLCLIMGKNAIYCTDVMSLFEKANETIGSMVKKCNEGPF